MPRRGTNVYRRKDGRWEGRLRCHGTSKYKSVYGKTYTEAKEKLNRLRMENAPITRSCSLLFDEAVMLWLDSVKNRIKESSYICYFNKIRLHISPYFKCVKYSKVTAVHIENFVSDKLSSGLSAKYVSDMVVMLKTAAKWLSRTYGYANLIGECELPKCEKKSVELLDKNQQIILQKSLVNKSDSTSVGVYLAMFTGLRIGEICALKWGDVDLENGILHISKTAMRIQTPTEKSKTAVKITAPKTANSVRDIPLPDFLVKKLSAVKKSDKCYVLSGNSHIVEPRCLSYRFKAILKKANLPSIKFHALRHTFATNCLQRNFDIKTLSEILGHASVDTTMRIYVHTSLERKRECMNLICPMI
jgi:site-specific recombinase XerD